MQENNCLTGGVTKKSSQEYLRMAKKIVTADGSHYKLPNEYKNACANVHNSDNSAEFISEKRAVEQKIEQLYAELTNSKQKQSPNFLGKHKTELFAKASKDPNGKLYETTFPKVGVKVFRIARPAKILTQVSFASHGVEGILPNSICRAL